MGNTQNKKSAVEARWYHKSAHDALSYFNVVPTVGLDGEHVAKNKAQFGKNILAFRKKETIFDVFIAQFKSPLIYILLLAAAAVFYLGEHIDGVVILAVVTLNAFIGTFQEGRARNALEKLKDLTKPKVIVRRDAQEKFILSEEVVPGDIIILREGDKVAADSRIIFSQNLTLDESILTGEAYPVAKNEETIARDEVVIGDQKNILFSGTSVVAGYAEAVVVATGLSSELGRISQELLQTSDVPLPLMQKITQLTRLIGFAVAIIGLVILLIGVLQAMPIREITATVIGLSVSIIPEGLPVVVTIVLAVGVWQMARAKAVVKQMAAVEAMGNANVLLVDKTGTITTGQMAISTIDFNGQRLAVTQDGYRPEGTITGGAKDVRNQFKDFMGFVYLALKADVVEEKDSWKPLGDPTEAAIAVLCRKLGHSKHELSKHYKIANIQPFDSKKRYLEATIHRSNDTWRVYVGAPEFLKRDLHIDHDLISAYHSLTKKGLRVVGVAVYGPQKNHLLGYALLAIEEAIRPNVSDAIGQAKRAGFRVVMMTGDFAQTAQAIAQSVGIYQPGDTILTGKDIEKYSERDLRFQIEKVSVYARITPEHKLTIVNAFKKSGFVVAMTGDGVNDGPALQAADLGIGLGSGTQVAQDASDIVLLDNNFATIVGAIIEGRGIYLKLKKVILYLFSTGFGEAITIIGSILVGLPLPLVAVQIIWLNFVTDSFLDIALAQDPTDLDLRSHKDTAHDQLVDQLMLKRIALVGATMLVASLPVFYYYLSVSSLVEARSMTLLVLAMTQWFNAFNVRSENRSVFTTKITNNRYLLIALGIVLGLQIFAMQTEFGNRILHTTPLTLNHWLFALVISSIVLFAEEGRKYFARHHGK